MRARRRRKRAPARPRARGKACPAKLPPLISWPGGKARWAKYLLRDFPAHETYVEPFAGGASVFFAKPLAGVNVLGDADRWPVELYRDVRKGALSRCQGGIRASRGLLKRALRRRSACYKVAAAALSYHGNRRSYEGKRTGAIVYRHKLRKHRCYAERLKRAWLVRGDFARAMDEFDSKKTLHFLDPPWPVSYSEQYHAHRGAFRGKARSLKAFAGAIDPKHVKRVCDRMKGHIVVVYNYHPAIARVFRGRGWKVRSLKSTAVRYRLLVASRKAKRR